MHQLLKDVTSRPARTGLRTLRGLCCVRGVFEELISG